MVVLIVFALGGLVCCWVWSDVSTRAKGILSALYAGSWGLLLLPRPGAYLFPLAQCGFGIAFGGLAFGIDWLMRGR